MSSDEGSFMYESECIIESEANEFEYSESEVCYEKSDSLSEIQSLDIEQVLISEIELENETNTEKFEADDYFSWCCFQRSKPNIWKLRRSRFLNMNWIGNIRSILKMKRNFVCPILKASRSTLLLKQLTKKSSRNSNPNKKRQVSMT